VQPTNILIVVKLICCFVVTLTVYCF